MATKLNYWDWNQFTGLADTNVVGSKGQYDNESYNIDTQTEPNGVKLSPLHTLYHTTTDTPSVIVNLADYGQSGIITCTDDGKVYKNGALIYTLVSGDEIRSAVGQYNNLGYFYLLLFTDGAIHRMDIVEPIGVDVNWKTFANETGQKYPLNIYGNVYFTSKNKFYKLDALGALDSNYTFPEQDTVAGMTFFQDNFNIYTSGGNYGNQYLFPIEATTPYYNIQWKGLPILGVTNLGSIDYVVTGYNKFYSDLYIVSGTQRKLLKVNNEGANGRGFYGLIFSRLDDIYLSGKFGTSVTEDRLYKFGSYYRGFSDELTPFIGELTDEITSINSSSSAIYFGTRGNEVYIIDMNQPSGYQTTGEIVSMMMDFGSPDTLKSLQGFEISYSNKDTSISTKGGTLTLYARQSEEDIWTEIKTTGNKTDIGKVRVDASEIITKGFGNFHQIQLKVKLDKGVGTPFLKKVRVLYQDNLST